MDKILKDTLTFLGLTTIEIRFFLACFEIGPATIYEIAKEARLKRSTAYLIAQQLLEKRLLLEDLHQYKKKLATVEPSDLLRMLSAKQRILGRQEIELKEKLPELQSLYRVSTVRPKVKVYEGLSGLLATRQDILQTKTEILLWTNQATEGQFFTPLQHQKFVDERMRKNIFIRVLAVDNKEGRGLKKEDLTCFRETRLLPELASFSPETYIYDDKIAILDHTKDIIGVIVQSEPIAQSQRTLFELAWKQFSK